MQIGFSALLRCTPVTGALPVAELRRPAYHCRTSPSVWLFARTRVRPKPGPWDRDSLTRFTIRNLCPQLLSARCRPENEGMRADGSAGVLVDGAMAGGALGGGGIWCCVCGMFAACCRRRACASNLSGRREPRADAGLGGGRPGPCEADPRGAPPLLECCIVLSIDSSNIRQLSKNIKTKRISDRNVGLVINEDTKRYTYRSTLPNVRLRERYEKSAPRKASR